MDYRRRLRDVREDRELTQAQTVKLCRYYDLSADDIVGLTNKPRSYKE